VGEKRMSSVGDQWSASDIPDQAGRVALVTGADSGLGFETARMLACHGAAVVLASRDTGKVAAAADRIRSDVPKADLTVLRLDLASLHSVREAADEFSAAHDRLDLLINNAGVMWPPQGITEDGFETQFGINHLGHFALTGHLIGTMWSVPGSRVVTVSSAGHRRGTIHFDDLQFERTKYRPPAAYGQSKLANLLFTYELQRRLTAAGAETVALAVHPGLVPTGLYRHISGGMRVLVNTVMRFMSQSDATMGALPTLRAATDPGAKGGEYYGPSGGSKGYPQRAESSARSHEADVQARLWVASERLTGVTYADPLIPGKGQA
jgi:NAD(P)-dependent dehydrogenase (short-subunit alcohol dehydrogenase family)